MRSDERVGDLARMPTIGSLWKSFRVVGFEIV
jgi:hypothetical protein